MPSAKRRNPSSNALKNLKDTFKYDTRLLGAIQRDIMKRRRESDRETKCIHPSEMARADWCPRATYYRITDTPKLDKEENPSWFMENIFDEGHDIHQKWQHRVWNIGKLRGFFECLACGEYWAGVSPRECRACKKPRKYLRYREVPIQNIEHLIIGHSDGDIAEGNEDQTEDPLLEVKSIGRGTVRFDAPKLLAKHTHRVTDEDGKEREWVDLEKLWADIRRPFPSHLKQGYIYCYCHNRKTIIFIYEFKPTQQVKEFVVRFQPHLIEDLLDKAKDVRYAIKVKRPPERPEWAEGIDGNICQSCPWRQTCWNENSEEETTRGTRIIRRKRSSPSPSRKTRIRTSSQTDRRESAERPPKSYRASRSQDDESVRPLGSVVRLLERPGSTSGNRRIRRISRQEKG